MSNKYELLAEKFIKEDDLTGNTIMETLARGIKMFAKWLDDQQKECGATYGHGSTIHLQTGKCICGKPYSPPIGSTIIRYLNVGKMIECGSCHPEKFEDCKEIEKKYPNIKCDCICHQETKPRKKIELLEKVIHPEENEIKWPFASSLLEILNEERNKINEIIDFLNAEK